MLASASNAIIIGFNVRPDPVAEEDAAQDDVDMRTVPHHLRLPSRRSKPP